MVSRWMRSPRSSHALSAALDASDVMGEAPYVLEVSSPGVDRPLTERRHWLRARGRLVRAVLAGGGEPPAGCIGVDDDGIELRGHRPAGLGALVRGRRGRVPRPDDAAEPADDAAGEPADEAGTRGRADDGPATSRTGEGGGELMDIDMAALRALEREKEIPFDLLVAHHRAGPAAGLPPHRGRPDERPGGAGPQERPRRGLGRGTDADGRPRREWDDTPEGFGRIAAATARQTIMQRLRDVEDEQRARRVPRSRGGHRRRGGAAEQRPADGARRPRQRRGRAAAAPSRCRGRRTCTAPGCAAT